MSCSETLETPQQLIERIYAAVEKKYTDIQIEDYLHEQNFEYVYMHVFYDLYDFLEGYDAEGVVEPGQKYFWKKIVLYYDDDYDTWVVHGFDFTMTGNLDGLFTIQNGMVFPWKFANTWDEEFQPGNENNRLPTRAAIRKQYTQIKSKKLDAHNFGDNKRTCSETSDSENSTVEPTGRWRVRKVGPTRLRFQHGRSSTEPERFMNQNTVPDSKWPSTGIKEPTREKPDPQNRRQNARQSAISRRRPLEQKREMQQREVHLRLAGITPSFPSSSKSEKEERKQELERRAAAVRRETEESARKIEIPLQFLTPAKQLLRRWGQPEQFSWVRPWKADEQLQRLEQALFF